MGLNGRCACGEVRYEITGEPLFTHACHCVDCQRTTGSAFVIHTVLCEEDLVINGATRTGIGPSGSGAGCEMHGCESCGVIIWLRYLYHQVPVIVVRTGTLEDPNALPPRAHIFTSQKQPWFVLPDDVPTFVEAADRDALWPASSIARYNALAPRG